jgi:apolipoprotein D and lipocalin family protein
VGNFDVQRYQGTWYEIARLDHRFERSLTRVSATYTPRDDGGVAVHNRGYDAQRGLWKEVRGRAYFVEDSSKGRLKVTFFWPFYGAYNLIVLDQDGYSFAMVCGPSRSYLWVLAREKTLPAPVLNGLISEAKRLGFATDGLIFVTHDDEPDAARDSEHAN